MREVKFRGKVDEQQWWYFVANDRNEGESEQFWGMVRRKTVGQFTGLKDCKGTEIFEGDIIATDIQWFDDEYGYDRPASDEQAKKNRLVEDMGIDLFHAGDFSIYPGHVEVIGNIHDDPHLLPPESEG